MKHATLLGTIALSLALLAPARALAADEKLALGDVSSLTPAADLSLVRATSHEEIARLAPPARAAVVVSVSVVSLDSSVTRDGVAASCEVSTTIRDAKKGTILAMTRGRARADGQRTSLGRVRQMATRQAVSSALALVPEALK